MNVPAVLTGRAGAEGVRRFLEEELAAAAGARLERLLEPGAALRDCRIHRVKLKPDRWTVKTAGKRVEAEGAGPDGFAAFAARAPRPSRRRRALVRPRSLQRSGISLSSGRVRKTA